MRDVFPINEATFRLFEPFGISEGEFLSLPNEEYARLMDGRLTSMLPVRIKNEQGETVEQMARLGLKRGQDGTIQTRVYPHYSTIQAGDLCLSKRELRRFERGEKVIYAEVKIRGGGRNRYFIQLDPLTNCLMYAKADDVGKYIPTDIFGTELTREQRDKIWEGKKVEVIANDHTYVVGVDLETATGFKTWRIEE